jgi:hypothetical protein
MIKKSLARQAAKAQSFPGVRLPSPRRGAGGEARPFEKLITQKYCAATFNLCTIKTNQQYQNK